MTADLFTSEDTTQEALLAAFDAALFEVGIDEDGDLYVLDRFKVFVMLHRGRTIRFSCAFGLKDDCLEHEVHALCNRINAALIIIRACAISDTRLLIDWHIPLRGGIAKKAVVRAMRDFNELVASIAEYDLEDLIL